MKRQRHNNGTFRKGSGNSSSEVMMMDWTQKLCSLPSLLLVSIIVHFIISLRNDGLVTMCISSPKQDDPLRYFQPSYRSQPHHHHHLNTSADGNPNRSHQTIRKFTRCPRPFCKRYFVRQGPNHHVLRRALHHKGWQSAQSPALAQFIYSKGPRIDIQLNLQKWQRYNHHVASDNWDAKNSFADTMMQYQQATGKPVYIPETYNLSNDKQRRDFEQRLKHRGGMSIPWVLKKPTINNSKGITMLGPHTDKLAKVLETTKEENNVTHVIQRYICNELTFYGRKMDFRVFWMVASMDPLIVMYHDGYMRIGSEYSEKDFSTTQAHLTTNTNLSIEKKGSWQDFEDLLTQHAAKHTPHITNPMKHVRDQFKHSLAQMSAAFAESTLNMKRNRADNSYGIFGADFVIDNDLDTWFIEPQRGPAINDAYMFRQDQNNILFPEMVGIVGEIIDKQAAGLPIFPLEEQEHYEIVYEDGWLFEYDGYQRVKDKKACQATKTK